MIAVVFIFGLWLGQTLNIKSNKKETTNIKNQTIQKKNIKDFNKNENILFLGDSITQIYPVEELLGDLPIVKSGVSGYKTTDILEKMNSMVYQYNPTKVFLLIGTNDYMKNSEEETTKEIVTNIDKIIKNIQKNRKNAKIYLESIYPVNRNMDKEMVAARKNEVIEEANQKLKIYCKKNDVIYIDMYHKLIDEDGNFKEEYTYDGLHPSSLGYGRITNVLLPYLYDNYELG